MKKFTAILIFISVSAISQTNCMINVFNYDLKHIDSVINVTILNNQGAFTDTTFSYGDSAQIPIFLPSQSISCLNSAYNYNLYVYDSYIGCTTPQLIKSGSQISLLNNHISGNYYVLKFSISGFNLCDPYKPTAGWADYVFKKDYKLMPLAKYLLFISVSPNSFLARLKANVALPLFEPSLV